MKSDVWSLGISMSEMADGKNPFAGKSTAKVLACNELEVQVLEQIDHRELPTLSHASWSYAFVDFVNKCLVRDVKERPYVDDLMKVRIER